MLRPFLDVSRLGLTVLDLLLSVTLITAVLSQTQSRRTFGTAIVLAVPALIAFWSRYVLPETSWIVLITPNPY